MKKVLVVLAASGVLFVGCSMETEPVYDNPGSNNITLRGKVSCEPGDWGKVWFQMLFVWPDPQNPNLEQWQQVGPKWNYNCSPGQTPGPVTDRWLTQVVSHNWQPGQLYPYRLAASLGEDPGYVETTMLWDKDGNSYMGWDEAYLADPFYSTIWDYYACPLNGQVCAQ